MPELEQKKREEPRAPEPAPERSDAGEQEINMPQTDEEIDQLMNTLMRGSAYKKVEASRKLGKMGARAVPTLIQSLHDEDRQVRWRAAIALGAMGPAAADRVIDVLESSPSAVRIPAVWAAAEIGDAKAVDPLVTIMCSDPSECCQVMAAAALLKLGDPKGVGSVREECTKRGGDFTGQVLEAYWGT